MVYVRWYGKVLEGSVVREHDLMGMTAVRIVVQGTEATALFTPGHVYQSEDEARGGECQKQAVSVPEPQLVTIPAVFRDDAIDRFKKAHWDAEHNHLRTDALGDFYQLWRNTHGSRTAGEPAGTVAKPAPKRIVSDERMQEIKERLKEAVKPQPRKVVQLSLFG